MVKLLILPLEAHRLYVKKYDKELSANCIEKSLYDEFVEAGSDIAKHYEARNFSHAMRLIMKLADKANQYIDEKKAVAISEN